VVSLEYFGATDPGKVRENNEDSLLLGDGKDRSLLVVADGIGGFEAGEVASRLTIDVLRHLEPGDSLEEAIQHANRKILNAARQDSDLAGMGTTVVAMRFSGTTAEIAHVGDSRAYLMHGEEMNPVTEDHSLVAELIRSGDITRDQAQDHPQKNLITRALGAEESVEVDISELRVRSGDRILLCTDGLTDMVSEREIERILRENRDPEIATKRLISAALEAGGADNVTVIVTDIREDPEQDAAPQRRRRNGDTEEIVGFVPPPQEDEPERSTREVNTRSRNSGNRRTQARSGRRGRNLPRRRRKLSAFGRFLKTLTRGLVALAVVGLILLPAYLWGSSRYFLGVDEGTVVVYRGLPYAPLGIDLNEEWQRTDLQVSQVDDPYRQQLDEQRLYDRDTVEAVVRDLREE
jgi:PPM family protein phosphatase